MRISLACLTALIVIAAALSAQAHEGETLFNRVYLEAQAEREVKNDEIVVLLVSRHQGKSPQEIAGRVNADMDWAIKQAKAYPEIRTATESYTTSPLYDKGVIQGWEARQELRLTGTAIARVTELTGALQERLQVSAMEFQPTRALREATTDELVEEALQSFRRRAELVGRHMDGKEYRIVELHVSTQGPVGPVIRSGRAMMMKAETAPAVEAGTSTVQVTVSGNVQFY